MDNGRQKVVRCAGAPNGKSVAIHGRRASGLFVRDLFGSFGLRRHGLRPPRAGGRTRYLRDGRIQNERSAFRSKRPIWRVRLGVVFRVGNAEISAAKNWPNSKRENDAVFLGVGLGQTTKLEHRGRRRRWEFSTRCNGSSASKRASGDEVPIGRVVAVVGAGNTAVDAATQAKRLGAERVIMVYRRSQSEMPAYDYEYELAKSDAVEFRLEKRARRRFLPTQAAKSARSNASKRRRATPTPTGALAIHLSKIPRSIFRVT